MLVWGLRAKVPSRQEVCLGCGITHGVRSDIVVRSPSFSCELKPDRV